MCAGKESSGVLGDLHEKIVTLKHTTTESSVIATRSVGGASQERLRQIVVLILLCLVSDKIT